MLAFRTDAKKFDAAEAQFTFIKKIIANFSTITTESAQKLSGWLTVWVDAFPKEYAGSVVNALTNSVDKSGKTIIEGLAAMPDGVLEFVAKKAKGLAKDGKTVQQIQDDVAETFMSASSLITTVSNSLKTLNYNTGNNSVRFAVGLMDAFDSMNMSMIDTAKTVLSFADTVSKSFKLTGDKLNDALTGVINQWIDYAKNKKINNSQFAALSQGTFAVQNVGTSLGLTSGDSLKIADMIYNIAQKASLSDYKPVSDAERTLAKTNQKGTKQEIADAQTALNDALTEYNVKFTESLKTASAGTMNNVLFMNTIFLASAKKMGGALETVVSQSNDFVEALGGIDKAMQLTDKNMNFIKGDEGFKKWKMDTAELALEQSLKSINIKKENLIKAYLDNPFDASISQTMGLLVDATSATESYNDAIKSSKTVLSDFRKTIDNWIADKRVNLVGNAQTQLLTAQSQFDTLQKIIRDNSGKFTNEQKTDAMNKITSAADSVISKTEAIYAHGTEGTRRINDVIAQMENLPNVATINQQMLDELKVIAENTKETKESNAILTHGYEALIGEVRVLKADLVKAQNENTKATQQTCDKIAMTSISNKLN